MLKQYLEKDKLEVGIDEVGRGCLFGPVCVAGVIWLDKDPVDSNIYKDYFIKDSKKCSEKKLKILEIEHLAPKKASRISGGEKQRVAIARALINNPSIIMGDEPTGNLNSKQGEEIMELFKQLNQEGVTIVQVTHSEKNAAYGSRIINLLDGRRII